MPSILTTMNKEIYEQKPAAMRAYLANYGWHFNKAMQEWAASRMVDRKGEPIKPYTKENLETLFKNYGVNLQTEHWYDALYVANMCKADFLGSSVPDELHLARFVADYLGDKDGYKEQVFARFYTDTCLAEDCTIYWEDML